MTCVQLYSSIGLPKHVVCGHVRIDTCVDMCVDTCVDMCVDMRDETVLRSASTSTGHACR